MEARALLLEIDERDNGDAARRRQQHQQHQQRHHGRQGNAGALDYLEEAVAQAALERAENAEEDEESSDEESDDDQEVQEAKSEAVIAQEKAARRLDILRKGRNPRDMMYTMQTKNNIVYHGTCVNRLPHGFGRKTFGDGSYYEGDWKLGKRHGSGIFRNPKANTLYEGEWRHGKRDGSGRCRRTALGNWVEYDGWWTKNRKNGEGEMRWSHGRKLRGTWRNGELIDIEIDVNNRDHGLGCIDPSDMSLNFMRMQMDPNDVAKMLQDDEDDHGSK